MKLISWNTNGRKNKAEKQVAVLLARKPDVVALQEVRLSSAPILKRGLVSGGLLYIRKTAVSHRRGPRATGVLIASRFPIKSTPSDLSVQWREKAMSVIVCAPQAFIEIHTVHVPPGSKNGWVKVKILRSVFTALARRTTRARILCGDFNAPQLERPSGVVVTWAERIDRNGRTSLRRTFRGGSGQQWDDAERNVLLKLRQFRMVDVYREIYGYKAQGYSWELRRGDSLFRRRFDHVFLSQNLRPTQCNYLHKWRLAKLSDHSAIEAVFNVA